MKKVRLTKTILIISALCMLCFSDVTAALFNQQEQAFSSFYQEPICPWLVSSYIEDGEIKPLAQASLPLTYYLHESIPQQYRYIFYGEAEAWNHFVGNEVIRIEDEIDQTAFDPQTNSSDQKNVIYLIDKEDYVHMLNSPNNDITRGPDALIPGISKSMPSKVENAQETLPLVFITDSDMLLREETLTDIGFYRGQLLVSMKLLGIEEDFNDKHIEVIRSAAEEHITGMSSEDMTDFLIRGFEAEETAIRNQNLDPSRLDDIERAIEQARNLTDEQIREIKIMLANRLLYVDIDLMESQSSIVFQNTVSHEMGHGLGLIDYTFPDNHPMRNLNIMRPHLIEESYRQLTILKEIDPSAFFGLLCLYSQYPNFTYH